MSERDENPYLYEYDSVIRSWELIAKGWQARAEAAERRVAELEARLAWHKSGSEYPTVPVVIYDKYAGLFVGTWDEDRWNIVTSGLVVPSYFFVIPPLPQP